MTKRYVKYVTSEHPDDIQAELNRLFQEADNPKRPVQSVEMIGLEHVGAFWFAWLYIVEAN